MLTAQTLPAALLLPCCCPLLPSAAALPAALRSLLTADRESQKHSKFGGPLFGLVNSCEVRSEVSSELHQKNGKNVLVRNDP